MFEAFPKIARLSREVVITEKLDGTNSQVFIRPKDTNVFEFGFDIQVEIDGVPFLMRAGSRNRWLSNDSKGDNFGFAKWVHVNAHELVKLGPGRHFGEWYGQGIQRGYGLDHRRFALFNVSRWADDDVRPSCCHVVPTLYRGEFSTFAVEDALAELDECGSAAVPGFMEPEGIIIYHTAANVLFKKTLEDDAAGKAQAA